MLKVGPAINSRKPCSISSLCTGEIGQHLWYANEQL